MARGNSTILVFVLSMSVLFALLYFSETTQSLSPNSPRIVHTISNNSNLSSLCLSIQNYESLFESGNGPMFGLPTYIPQGYALQCINVSGTDLSEDDRVSFYYFNDNQEFQSRFLPKIENGTIGHPMYEKEFPKFSDAGGIVITRSVEAIAQDDPRYNDKLKHIQIERAVADPRNDCSLPAYTRGECDVDLERDYPPIEFANGNPIVPTLSQQSEDGRFDGLLMFMDYNWLVSIVGTPDSDELFKMAETIHQISTTETGTSPSNEQTLKFAGLTQEQIILVKTSVRECYDKAAVVGMSADGEEASGQLQTACEEQESKRISMFLSSTTGKETITVMNETFDVGAGSYILYSISIPQNSTDVNIDGSYISNGSGIILDVFDEDTLDSWKQGDYNPPREPLVGSGAGISLFAVAGETVYLTFDNTADHDRGKRVEANFTVTYTRYIPT